MRVSCYCGLLYECDGPIAVCPRCMDPAVLPNLTDRDADQMRAELETVLAEHE